MGPALACQGGGCGMPGAYAKEVLEDPACTRMQLEMGGHQRSFDGRQDFWILMGIFMERLARFPSRWMGRLEPV